MTPVTTPVPESPSPTITDLISDLRSSFFSTNFQIFAEKLLIREQNMNKMLTELETKNESLINENKKLNDEIDLVKNEQLEYTDRINVLKSEKIRVLEKLGEVENELKEKECEFKKVKCELEMKVRVYEKRFSDMEARVFSLESLGKELMNRKQKSFSVSDAGGGGGGGGGGGVESSKQPLIIEKEDSEQRAEPDFSKIILVDDDEDDDDDNNDEFDDDDDQHVSPLKRKRVSNEVKIEYISDDSDLECGSTFKRNHVSKETEKGCTADFVDNFHSETPNTNNFKDAKRNEPKNLMSSFNSADSNSSEEIEKIDKTYMSLIAKLKKHKERWEFEADMVKEFNKDDQLCLNAICALRRQRIIIDDYDLLRINQLALLLIDGDSHGRLKKKASELSRSDLVQCRKFAKKYATKVFEIYQKRDDPFFPSSRS